MEYIKNKHGIFPSQEYYLAWCKATGNYPVQPDVVVTSQNGIEINDNYDQERRLRKQNDN